MKTAPLSTLFAGLADKPGGNDAGAIAKYRALCRSAQERVIQSAISLSAETLSKWPESFPEKASMDFAKMGRARLVTWARQSETWLDDLPKAERDRLGSTTVLLK